MKQNVNESQFIEAFDKMGRGNNFSQGGRMALFGYLVELEEDIGEEIELDVIALCCEWSEYPNIQAAAEDYQCEPGDFEEQATVIEIYPSQDIEPYSNGVIVASH